MFYNFITKYTDIFFVEKNEKVRKLHTIFNKNIGILEILAFEILRKRLLTTSLVSNNWAQVANVHLCCKKTEGPNKDDNRGNTFIYLSSYLFYHYYYYYYYYYYYFGFKQYSIRSLFVTNNENKDTGTSVQLCRLI